MEPNQQSVTSSAAVLRALAVVVEDLIVDWGLDVETLDGTTQVVENLDFASVDIIQLCVAVEELYSRKLGFQALLMVDGSYVSDLTLQQIADFVSGRLQQPESLT